MFGETDRFLEEVILSRRVGHGQGKNDFLPKRAAGGAAGLLPVVGEMSIQDLSMQDDDRT